MAAIQLNLTKPGEKKQRIELPLGKGRPFKIKLMWAGKYDLDLHALRCVNRGDGSKLESVDDILSTYAVKRMVMVDKKLTEVGIIPRNPDGSFQIHNGAMLHSKDAKDGDQADVDEFMIIDPTKFSVPNGTAIDIPLLATTHNEEGEPIVIFRQVPEAWLIVEDMSGVEVARIDLSTMFGDYRSMQAGSIFLVDGKVEFCTEALGSANDFNGILAEFQ